MRVSLAAAGMNNYRKIIILLLSISLTSCLEFQRKTPETADNDIESDLADMPDEFTGEQGKEIPDGIEAEIDICKPENEKCNGIDDNCNDLTDEGCAPAELNLQQCMSGISESKDDFLWFISAGGSIPSGSGTDKENKYTIDFGFYFQGEH
jgi:hypothetical protein